MRNSRWGLVLASALLAVAAGRAGAQQAGREMTRADSLELQQRERLQSLGRPPRSLPDSVRLDAMRADSIVRDSVQRAQLSSTAGTFQAGDSVTSALMTALTGYDATTYVAKKAEYYADRKELLLYGDSLARASLRQPTGDEVAVDSLIRFDQTSEVAEALGSPVYTPANGDPVNSQRLIFDTRARAGSAFEARTSYSQPGGTNWNLNGDLPLVVGDIAYGDHTRFTSCDLPIPHYHFETPELKIVRGKLLVARPVKLYFADVPVAWLPFIFQSLTRGRASGLLPPRFSVNDIVRTSGGYRRRISNVGFYWAINDYMDATVALDWFDNTYTGVTTNLRYEWVRKFLTGSATVRRFWRPEGRRELSFDTQQSWAMSERTNLTLSAQYATSTSFIRQNSYNPREVTSQIRSQGGLSRRFDWGTLNVSGDRSQSLSDDRVTMSLPRVGLSLRPITLFSAPVSRASWYNNLTWNGSVSFSRRITDNPDQMGGFSFGLADQVDMDGNVSSQITLGRFSWGQTLRISQGTVRDVPPELLPDPTLIVDPIADPGAGTPAFPFSAAILAGPGAAGVTDITDTDLTWTSSLSYQQPLIGTTTLTPTVSFSGTARKSDTLSVASGFVSSPTRVSFGAGLKTDFYGFYGGFAGFEAFRHKITTTFDYAWAPEVQPTPLQEAVFGSRTLKRQSAISIGFNQTWEGKRPVEEPAVGEVPLDSLGVPADSALIGAGAVPGPGPGPADQGAGGPQRQEQSQIVNILGINTSAVRYNFVSAEEGGDFLSGFETTVLNNTITSDYLRGITVQMTHDLFEEGATGPGGSGSGRKFSPHLSRLNFGFQLSPQSALVRLLGLGREGVATGGTGGAPPDPALEDPLGGVTDESSIIPGRAATQTAQRSQMSRGAAGDWNARVSYALNRPRRGGSSTSQMLDLSVNMEPTADWSMTWRTSYDVERASFNDHSINLIRHLHRWQANFAFARTTTGNWTFRFEVSLLDNQDLHFDYEQRSTTVDDIFRGVR